MIPDAFGRVAEYGELAMPVVIIAGELDRLIDIDRQSGQLTGMSATAASIRCRARVTWSIRPP